MEVRPQEGQASRYVRPITPWCAAWALSLRGVYRSFASFARSASMGWSSSQLLLWPNEGKGVMPVAAHPYGPMISVRVATSAWAPTRPCPRADVCPGSHTSFQHQDLELNSAVNDRLPTCSILILSFFSVAEKSIGPTHWETFQLDARSPIFEELIISH